MQRYFYYVEYTQSGDPHRTEYSDRDDALNHYDRMISCDDIQDVQFVEYDQKDDQVYIINCNPLVA